MAQLSPTQWLMYLSFAIVKNCKMQPLWNLVSLQRAAAPPHLLNSNNKRMLDRVQLNKYHTPYSEQNETVAKFPHSQI